MIMNDGDKAIKEEPASKSYSSEPTDKKESLSRPGADDDGHGKEIPIQDSSGSNKSYQFDSTKPLPRMPEELRRQSGDAGGSRCSTPLSSGSEDEDTEGEISDKPDDSTSTSRSPLSSRQRRSPLSPVDYIPTVDTMSNAAANVLTLTCGVMIFGVFLFGSYDYFKNVEENKCEMTWMYQPPYYIPISINVDPQEKDRGTFPMYKLYAYGEGEKLAQAMSRDDYRFNGIPVLYIPGNAGSYQQVRSLASVALWKYLDAGTPYHFDFFTVDLNEEFSGLYGYTLQRQVDFVRRAVTRITNLYEEFHRVVLIGHSMGGVIAKAVAMGQASDEESRLSNLIITLASPHASPVAILDPEQDIFYYMVSRNWTRNPETSDKIAMVSVAGGERDHLVLPKLTRWSNSVHTITTGVPGVWASTDHLCIVWCKQLVLTTIRALFDLVEFNQRNKYYAITENQETVEAVLKYHFQERTGGKSYHGSTKPSIITLSKTIEQIEVASGVYCQPGGHRSVYLLIPRTFLMQNLSKSDQVLDENDDHNIMILTTNTKDKAWISGCVEISSSGQCTHAENLAQFGKIVPHIRRRRKLANIPLSLLLTKYSHLVIKMDSYPFKTCMMLETFSKANRTLPLGGVLHINQKLFYNFTLALSGFSSYLLAWKVTVEPNNMTCPESHNLLAQFRHDHFEQSRFLKNESLIVRHLDWNATSSSVQLFLEPTCNYTVTTTVAWLETAGQFFRCVARLLPSFYASVVLMTLFFQKHPDEWSSFHIVLLSNAYHLSLFPGFCTAVLFHFIPTDWPLALDAGEFTVLIPMACYLIAYCLVLSVSTGTWYAIITGGTALHSVIVRVLSTRFGSWVPQMLSNRRGFSSVTEHVTEAALEMTLTRFPVTVAVALLAISFATCGSLGIASALVLYVVKLFKMYEDLLEDLLKAKITHVTDGLSQMNFHFSCYMLWLVLTVLNVPSLLHWSRSSTYEVTPQWDISMYICLLLLPTIAILWQDFVPKMEPTIWKLHRYVFYVMGMSCVLWGTHRLWVTAFIITFVFLTMAVCQLISVIMNSLPLPGNTNISSTTSQQEQSRQQHQSRVDSTSAAN